MFKGTLCAIAAFVWLAGGWAWAAEKGTAENPWVIGMSQCNLGEPWRVQMNADIEAAAKAHANVRMVFRDAQNDTLKQRAHIEEFAAQGVDLLLVSPKEAAPLTPPVAKVFKQGIPVIVLDRAVMGEDFSMFIGADNALIGEAAGAWLAERLGGRGAVVELKGLMTSTPGQDRHAGFRKGIAGSGLEVVFEADMKWLEPDARKEMESALARFPDIDAVYAHNDPGAHGAWLAAKAAGREKDIVFAGIDALAHEGQQYVRQGLLDVSFEYPTGGKEAIEYGLKLLGGEEVPRKLVVPSRVFTKDNIDSGGEWLGGAADAARE
jgi:ribose transport system substrate-binding protein